MADDVREREGRSGAGGDVEDGQWSSVLGWLVNGDPEHVRGLLDSGAVAGARRVAPVYRASAHLHRDAGAGVRRQLLALDAARHGDGELSALISAVPVRDTAAATWGVEWATGGGLDARSRRVPAGRTSRVEAVATGVVEGRPVAVTGSWDRTVRVWDLATGGPVGQPLEGHADRVRAVATGLVDGRPLAVTGGDDGAVRVWDLTSCQQIGEPLVGHTDWVRAVATAVVDGRPVAVTGGGDGSVRVWDLTTGQQIGEPLTAGTGEVLAVATAVVDGRPVAVTGGEDATVRVWDLATGRPVGEPWQDHRGWVRAVATGVVDGRPVAVTGGGVWDLTTRQQVGEPARGHYGGVYAVATGLVDGRPVAVTGGEDAAVCVWDLATGRPVGDRLVFPSAVGAVALDDRLVVGFASDVAVLSRR